MAQKIVWLLTDVDLWDGFEGWWNVCGGITICLVVDGQGPVDGSGETLEQGHLDRVEGLSVGGDTAVSREGG